MLTDATALLGRRLGPEGRYQVVALLAHGGMGSVFRAREAGLERDVAIKILPPAIAQLPDALDRFRREARAIARLEHHPNILPVYAFGEEDGVLYLVMRLARGGSLKDRLQPPSRPWSPDKALWLAEQVLPALGYAHGEGIVHRDVKPANILFDGDRAYLADFGIAKFMQDTVGAGTFTGGIGTALYMAPEQVAGLPLEGRADLYAFGVVLYELLAGRVPYQGDTPLSVAVQHAQAPLPAPRQFNAALVPAIEAVLVRALAKAPEQRFANGGDFLAALTRAAASRGRAPAATVAPPAARGGAATVAPSSPPAVPAAGTGTVGGHAAARRLLLGSGAAGLVAVAGGLAFGIPRLRARGTPEAAGPVATEVPLGGQALPGAPAAAAAASPASSGSAAGAAAPGQFKSVSGIALDAQGSVYVADTGNHRVQKLSPAGQVLAVWGGRGDGPGQFNRPLGLALDAQGNLYVADSGNGRIQKLAPAGEPLARWGRQGERAGEFNTPAGLALDGEGNLYVADSGNHRIQKLSPAGAPLARWGGKGQGPGQFDGPVAVAVDGQRNVVVADTDNNRVQRLSATGQVQAIWGTAGTAPGEFAGPRGLALDAEGNLYVADGGNNRVQKLSGDGRPLAQWDIGGPAGLAFGVQGHLYVAELDQDRIRELPVGG